jgi:hypothetical protein
LRRVRLVLPPIARAVEVLLKLLTPRFESRGERGEGAERASFAERAQLASLDAGDQMQKIACRRGGIGEDEADPGATRTSLDCRPALVPVSAGSATLVAHEDSAHRGEPNERLGR